MCMHVTQHRQSLIDNTVNTVNTVVRGASSTSTPPGQPDHMPTRGPVSVCSRLGSQHVPSTQHKHAYSPHRRTQNERHSAASVQLNTRWLGPRHITRKQQSCLAWVRMSAPEYHISTLTHAQFAASHCAIPPPQFQVVAGYVPTM